MYVTQKLNVYLQHTLPSEFLFIPVYRNMNVCHIAPGDCSLTISFVPPCWMSDSWAGSWLVNAARIDAKVQIFQLGRQTRIRVKHINAQKAHSRVSRQTLNSRHSRELDARMRRIRVYRAALNASFAPRDLQTRVNASLHWLNIEIIRARRSIRVWCEHSLIIVKKETF